jgi:hypothetical protein
LGKASSHSSGSATGRPQSTTEPDSRSPGSPFEPAGLPAEVPSLDSPRRWDERRLDSYEAIVRRAAEEQSLVVQKRRTRAATASARLTQRSYRLRHWATRDQLVDDTPPPADETAQPEAGDWVSLRHAHAILLNRDIAGRIDRWWHRLTEAEQQRVLDNTGQLPERFVAGLSAAGIGTPVPGRLPHTVRAHLERIGASPTAVRHPRVPLWDALPKPTNPPPATEHSAE